MPNKESFQTIREGKDNLQLFAILVDDKLSALQIEV